MKKSKNSAINWIQKEENLIPKFNNLMKKCLPNKNKKKKLNQIQTIFKENIINLRWDYKTKNNKLLVYNKSQIFYKPEKMYCKMTQIKGLKIIMNC